MTPQNPVIKKISAFLLLVLTFFFFLGTSLILHGCSVSSPIFSARNDKTSLIIEKPPTRIIISGEYGKLDVENILKVMRELRKHAYHDYNFDNSVVIDSEHVSTTNEKHQYSYHKSSKSKK